MPPSKAKRELQSFLGILNYLSMFSPNTAKVCEPKQKMILVRTDWTWNRMYQDLYDKAKKIVKKDACMNFMTWLDPYTYRLMHLVSALEQGFYR